MDLNKAEKFLCNKSYLYPELYSKMDRRFHMLGGKSEAFQKICKALKKKWQNDPLNLQSLFEKDGPEVTGTIFHS